MKKYSNILDEPLEVKLTGPELLASPLLNKGTAFSEEERDEFCLQGCFYLWSYVLLGNRCYRFKFLIPYANL